MAGVECILGYRGAGKSTLARALCAGDSRLIVCDTTGEYTQARHWVPEATAYETREAVLSGEPFRLGYIPDTLDDVQWLERLVASQQNITLLIDEIDLWYKLSTMPLGEGLSWIAKTGRHYNQRVVAIARLASRMPLELRDEGTLWVFPLRNAGTRRMVVNCTDIAFDPIRLRVLKGTEDRVEITQVARIAGPRLQVLEFETATGRLYESRTAVSPETTIPPTDAPDDPPESDESAEDSLDGNPPADV